jgi:hypothetical protein
LRTFDFQIGHWRSFAPWGVNVSWSPDSHYVYFDSFNRYPRAPETIPGFFCYRIRDELVEKVFGVRTSTSPAFGGSGFQILCNCAWAGVRGRERRVGERLVVFG